MGNRRLSHELKLSIVELHRSGKKVNEIVKKLSVKGYTVSRQTVTYWIRNYQHGYFNPYELPRKVRVFKKVSERDLEVVQNSLKLNVNQSCRDLHRELKADGADFSLSTTRNLLKAAGYVNDTPRYAQMVRGANLAPRVIFCEMLISNNDNMSDIIFTDESTVQLHNNKTTSYRLKESMNVILPKPKHPLKVHVWAGISRRGPTKIFVFEGIMESKFFTESILKNTLLPFIKAVYPDGHRFQQDNDPKHRSKLSQNFMKDNGINWWNVWPSESPDLNPIEMVWNQLKRAIAKSEPRTKDELVKAITDFWYQIMTVELCNRYIDHIYKVAPICVAMKGKATGNVPNQLFTVRSEGKSFRYFADLMEEEQVKARMKQLNIGQE